MTSVKTFYSVSGPTEADVGVDATYELNASAENGAPKDVDINLLKGTIVRSSVGCYKIIVRPSQGGSYYLDVTVGGRAILMKDDMQTEFKGNAQAERPRITFQIEGHGIHGGRVGESVSFTILVTGPGGAPIDIDARRLRVSISGPQQPDIKVVRESIGAFTTTFRVLAAGNYLIDVNYDGNEVINQTAIFSSATAAGASTLFNLPPATVRVRNPIHFGIQSREASGKVVSVGGDEWQAVATGPDRVTHLYVTDNQNGTYTGEIIFPSPGSYLVQVMLEGEPAAGSPLKVEAVQ